MKIDECLYYLRALFTIIVGIDYDYFICKDLVNLPFLRVVILVTSCIAISSIFVSYFFAILSFILFPYTSNLLRKVAFIIVLFLCYFVFSHLSYMPLKA